MRTHERLRGNRVREATFVQRDSFCDGSEDITGTGVIVRSRRLAEDGALKRGSVASHTPRISGATSENQGRLRIHLSRQWKMLVYEREQNDKAIVQAFFSRRHLVAVHALWLWKNLFCWRHLGHEGGIAYWHYNFGLFD